MLKRKVIGRVVPWEAFQALKAKVDKYHPDADPEPEGDGYAVFTSRPTVAVVAASVNPSAGKPTEAITVDMTGLTKPTMCYLAYPQSWEVVQNGILMIPFLVDSNGFEVGATFDDETPTVMVSGVTYRVLDIRLGKGVYKLNFNR